MFRADHSSGRVLPSVVFQSVTNSKRRPTRAVELFKEVLFSLKIMFNYLDTLLYLCTVKSVMNVQSLWDMTS
jgi:hypothetical protein